ncbi:MAG: hypothetical protein JNM43_18855 [Planctomycetaceae bacterium]|nr:hypothetical protein [Planctomycetaceae bacterium]
MFDQNPADRALKLLARFGATIEYSDRYPEGLVNLDQVEIADEDLEELIFSPGFATLVLDRTQISDAGLAFVGQMPALDTLSLNRTNITDAGLSELQGCLQLTTLDIGVHCQCLPPGLRPAPPGNIQRNLISNAASGYLVEMPFLQRLHIGATHIDDHGLRSLLPSMPQLCDLNLSYLNMTSAGLLECLSLRSLESLNLRHTAVGGAEIVDVVSYFSFCLKSLNVSNTTIDDEALSKFPRDGALDSLKLTDTGISDQGLRSVSKFINLRSLKLGLTDVFDDGVRFLGDARTLRSLDLFCTKVSDTGLVWLSENPLETLSLCRTSVTDAGMPDLAEMSAIESLDLSHNAITDRGIRFLLASKSLKTLSLEGTQITASGVAMLSELGLRTLSVDRGVSKTSLQRLAETGTLRSLAIWRDVESLEPLSQMSQLRVLLIDDSVQQLSPVGQLRTLEFLFLCGKNFCPIEVARLRSQIPRCRIYPYSKVGMALRDFRRVAIAQGESGLD